jgi:YD repeat-containing protein
VPWALTSHIDTLGPNGRIETVLFTDGLKRVVQTKKDAHVPGASTTGDVMTVSGRVIFDAFGRTIAQFYPVTEALGQQRTFNATFDTSALMPTTTTYDILDRALSVTIPDNTTTTSAYDFGADRSGQTRFRTTVTDAKGKQKQMFRDVRSQITTVNEFHNAAVFHTSYAYDPVRQITGVTDDQGNVTSVAYDLFGRRTAINSPDAGLTAFTYDLADNLIAKQTANLAGAGNSRRLIKLS